MAVSHFIISFSSFLFFLDSFLDSFPLFLQFYSTGYKVTEASITFYSYTIVNH